MRWALALLVLLAACKRSPPPPPDSGSVDLFALRPVVPVPSDWPADVPIYKNARVFSAASHAVDGGYDRELMFDTSDSPELVLSFYRSTFGSMKRIYEMGVPSGTVLSYETVGKTISIVVMSYASSTSVVLSVTQS